ncbi:early growth response protein 1 [Aspergillus lentulus]|nr:early growth response protein 1 [Aspergillus lentulus]
MPPGSLTRFFALGLWYASLAFWSYRVESKAKDSRAVVGRPLSDRQSEVPDQRSIWTARKRPICGTLQTLHGAAVIADVSQIMDAVRALPRGDSHQNSVPPLVQVFVS